MPQKERVDIYIIPPNFAAEGTLFSGRIKARNAVEAAVLALFLLQILLSVDLSVRGRIYAGAIVLIPAAIFGVLGVQGESLTSFVLQFFRYLCSKRELTVPDGKYRLKRSRKIRKIKRREARRKGGGRNRKRSKGAETKAQRSQADGKTANEGGQDTGERK